MVFPGELLTAASSCAIAELPLEEHPTCADAFFCDPRLSDEIEKILRENIMGVMVQIKEAISTSSQNTTMHKADDIEGATESSDPAKAKLKHKVCTETSMQVAADTCETADPGGSPKLQIESRTQKVHSSASSPRYSSWTQSDNFIRQPKISYYRSTTDIQQSVKEHSRCRWVFMFDDMFSTCIEPDRRGPFSDFVSSRMFESAMLMTIIANTVFTIHQTNKQMSNPHMGIDPTSATAELIFTTLYLIEFVLKFLVHRCYMFSNTDKWWNMFDVAIVGMAVVELMLTYAHGKKVFSASFMRVLRIVRVVKVFRAVRVVQFVKELRLILKCVFGSFMSLLWSFVLLAGISILFAIVAVQQLTSALNEGQLPKDQVEIIYERFGSVQEASLTLFKSISGGEDWGPIYDLISKAGITSSVCFMAYVLLIWMSITNIITSVFVDKALKHARPDADDALMEKHKEDLEKVKQLRTIFQSIDVDGSGTLTLAELQNSFSDDRILSFFELQGLDIKSIETFFTLLTQISETHEVDVESFVTGCLKMRGYATNIDVFMLLFQTKALGDRLSCAIEQCKQEVAELRIFNS